MTPWLVRRFPVSLSLWTRSWFWRCRDSIVVSVLLRPFCLFWSFGPGAVTVLLVVVVVVKGEDYRLRSTGVLDVPVHYLGNGVIVIEKDLFIIIIFFWVLLFVTLTSVIFICVYVYYVTWYLFKYYEYSMYTVNVTANSYSYFFNTQAKSILPGKWIGNVHYHLGKPHIEGAFWYIFYKIKCT